MSIENLKDSLPEYAKDLKLNLSTLLNSSELSAQQLWGGLLAAAIASRSKKVLQAVVADAAQHLSDEAQKAAKAAAAIMGMNNIYYRFIHLASNKDYATRQAGLRMNILANPGVDKVDFELWSLVVSAVNGCGMCIDAHEKQLLKNGLNMDAVQTAVRIASVIHAIAVTIDAEESMSA